MLTMESEAKMVIILPYFLTSSVGVVQTHFRFDLSLSLSLRNICSLHHAGLVRLCLTYPVSFIEA